MACPAMGVRLEHCTPPAPSRVWAVISIKRVKTMDKSVLQNFLKRLRSGKANYMGWSGLSDPMLVGYIARAGYDAVLLDQQHGFHDTASCISCISEAALTGTPVIVRVSVNDFAQAARMLDCGATGVVAPMINSADDARRFVSHVKYPTLGQRSFGPGRAMQLSNATDDQLFVQSANGNTLAIAMCETREALDVLDEILDVPGLDGVLVGPADLSLALCGGIMDPNGSAVRNATLDVARRSRAKGKIACAFAGTVERSRELARDGFQLVSVEYDEKVIADAFAKVLNEAKHV